MTREEAIKEYVIPALRHTWNEKINKKVLEALEQEPTTKNDVLENNAENIYICSCGYGWDKSKVVRYHYCPNCGAKMEVDE